MHPRLLIAGGTALAMAGSALIGIGVKKVYNHYSKSGKPKLLVDATKPAESAEFEEPVLTLVPKPGKQVETTIVKPIDPAVQSVLDEEEPLDEGLEASTQYNDNNIDHQENLGEGNLEVLEPIEPSNDDIDDQEDINDAFPPGGDQPTT